MTKEPLPDSTIDLAVCFVPLLLESKFAYVAVERAVDVRDDEYGARVPAGGDRRLNGLFHHVLFLSA